MLIFQYRSGFHVFLALTIKEKMNERERSQAHALMISSICQVLGAGVGQGTPPLPVPPHLWLLTHALCLLFQMHTRCAMPLHFCLNSIQPFPVFFKKQYLGGRTMWILSSEKCPQLISSHSLSFASWMKLLPFISNTLLSLSPNRWQALQWGTNLLGLFVALLVIFHFQI